MQIAPNQKKIFIFTLYTLIFLAGCSGGSASSPQASIPAPAPGLISISSPDADGLVHVTGTEGAVEANSTVTVDNLTAQSSSAVLQNLLIRAAWAATATSVSVEATSTGSFEAAIAADIGDAIGVSYTTSDGQSEVTEVEVPENQNTIDTDLELVLKDVDTNENTGIAYVVSHDDDDGFIHLVDLASGETSDSGETLSGASGLSRVAVLEDADALVAFDGDNQELHVMTNISGSMFESQTISTDGVVDMDAEAYPGGVEDAYIVAINATPNPLATIYLTSSGEVIAEITSTLFEFSDVPDEMFLVDIDDISESSHYIAVVVRFDQAYYLKYFLFDGSDITYLDAISLGDNLNPTSLDFNISLGVATITDRENEQLVVADLMNGTASAFDVGSDPLDVEIVFENSSTAGTGAAIRTSSTVSGFALVLENGPRRIKGYELADGTALEAVDTGLEPIAMALDSELGSVMVLNQGDITYSIYDSSELF